jgi:DNA polymerase-3 subunit delta'
LNPLGRKQLADLLESKLEVPAAEAMLLAALAGGSFGRALELRGGGVLELRNRMVEAFDVPSGSALDGAEVERRVRRLERGWTSETAIRGAQLLILWWRDLTSVLCGLRDEELLNVDRAPELRAGAAGLTVPELSRRMRVLEEMTAAVGQNVNPVLALSAALARVGGGPLGEERLVRL